MTNQSTCWLFGTLVECREPEKCSRKECGGMRPTEEEFVAERPQSIFPPGLDKMPSGA